MCSGNDNFADGTYFPNDFILSLHVAQPRVLIRLSKPILIHTANDERYPLIISPPVIGP